MGEGLPAGRCRVVALVGRAGDGAVLAGERSGALPETVVEGEATTPAIEAAITALLGVLGPILRVTTVEVGEDHEPTLLAVEATAPALDPPGFAWRPLDARATDNAPASLAEVVRWWHGRLIHGPSPQDPAWSVPGWFERAAGWMTRRMAELGVPATAPPRLHSMWPISAILVAPSAAGRHFLKASPPVFAAEAVVTAALAERMPGAVTPVAAIEPGEGWLLMRDLGGPILGDAPAEAWAPGLVGLARLQRAWADDADRLATLGASRRPLHELAAAIPAMVEDPAIVGPLAPETAARYREAGPRLVEACLRLAELGPADGLVHGDLHPWNVAAGAAGPILFDWSDAAISHPFVDLPVYLTRTPDLAARRAMRSAYLAGWRDGAGDGELEEAADLAMAVGCAYQAETYRRLNAALDPHELTWLHGADGAWLGSAVAGLDEGIAVRGGAD